MQKKVKVFNISFEEREVKAAMKTNSSEFCQVNRKRTQMNFQNFMRSRQSTTMTYELLNIVKGNPETLNKEYHQKTNVPYTATQKENINPIEQSDASLQQTNPIPIQTIPEKITASQSCQLRNNQLFYLIPSKYQNSLELILSHFLNFKLNSVPPKQSHPGTYIIQKRPRTTCKNNQNSQNKSSNAEAIFSTKSGSSYCTLPLKKDFTDYFQKIISMQKQIQKKQKHIIFLENQLSISYQSVKQKTNEIKEMQQKQIMMKKKFKYQLERIIKGKTISDINEVYLTGLYQQNVNGKSIFEINGKRFIQAPRHDSFVDKQFIAAPNFCRKQKQNNNLFLSFGKSVKKTQSATFSRKTGQDSKQLQAIKLAKLIQTLEREIAQLKADRQATYDKLSFSVRKIEEYISKIENTLDEKKGQLQNYRDKLSKVTQTS